MNNLEFKIGNDLPRVQALAGHEEHWINGRNGQRKIGPSYALVAGVIAVGLVGGYLIDQFVYDFI